MKLKQVIEVIESIYPLSLAEKWDSNGLISGDLDQQVNKILIAIDPVPEVVDQAIELKADLLLTHHPLFLAGTKTVATNTAKGNMIHKLIKADCALYNAHTNADRAEYGVSTALAQLIPMTNVEVLEEVDQAEKIGLGRIGNIAQTTLLDFAKQLHDRLPKDGSGVKVGGNLQDKVKRIAFSPGAGQSMIETAKSKGADVFVCADLKHHVASEHLMESKPYLVCISHWASEYPWVHMAKEQLDKAFSQSGFSIEIQCSDIVTDPWAKTIL